MTEAKKRHSDHNQLPTINKSASNRNTDIFSEFETNRRVLRDEKDNLPKMNGQLGRKLLAKNPSYEDDEYNQDFQPAQNVSSLSKKKIADTHNFKPIQKKKQSNHKLVLDRATDGKSQLGRQVVKSAMQTSTQNINQQVGRYEAEVDKKFGTFSFESSTNDLIIKNSEQIRENIKKYNQILTDLINKNLAELANKKRKKTTPEQVIKVLQQEIKNNAKIEQMDVAELGRLSQYRDKLEEQENYSETNLQEEVHLLNVKIKQRKKEIYDMKLAVQNQAKKLVPSGNSITNKTESHSEVTITKEKLTNIRKEYQKNEEKMSSLDTRLNDLNKKIESLGGLDKEADQLRSSTKKTEDKNKKHQEVKKKYDSSKLHLTKTDALWHAKCSVITHQNDGMRLKIKNIELQVKNMEEEAKQIYQKSIKTLNTCKPKNEQNQKNLDKILAEMSSFNQNLTNKQMSLSQMKMLTRKKTSVDQLSTNVIRQPQKQYGRANQNQTKTKSQQSQRNRIWKEQNTKKENAQDNEAKLHESKTQKNNITHTQTKAPEKQLHQEKIQISEKNDDQNKGQAKPKKFNFNKSKHNQQPKNDQTTTNINHFSADQKKEQHKNVEKLPEAKEKNEQKPKQNPKKSLQEPKKTEEQEIKPKRFNLNLRDRKAKEESGGYMPSVETQQGMSSKEQKQKVSEPNQTKELDKPTFNLRRKRDAQNKDRQGIQNEFMGQ